jgi:protein-S-isoprenylcysteine O-methyltransferase Ste14
MLLAATIAIYFKKRVAAKPPPRRSNAEPSWLSPLIIVVALALGLATLDGLIRYSPNWFAPTSLQSSTLTLVIVSAIGSLASAGGCILMFYSLAFLDTNFSGTSGTHSDHELITSGPYQYMRHPYYTATLLISSGIGLLLQHPAVLGLGFLLFGLLSIRSRAEECELGAKFPLEYRPWQQRTGRFLPRLSPKR